MQNKSATLTNQEKALLKYALFLYQKDVHEKYGSMTTSQNDSIKHIVDALHL